MGHRRRRSSDSSGGGDVYAEEESPLLESWQGRSEQMAQANPLLMASSGFGPLSERGQAATQAYEEEAARMPNVLVRPPGDFGGMRTEKQIAWQQNLRNQADLDQTLLNSESKRRQDELADITRKEGLEIIKRSGELDPTADDYRAKKAALVRQFPGGAASTEAKAIFEDLDARRRTVEAASEEEKKSVVATERLRGENNFGVARTEAATLGPEFLGQFLEISKAQGPDAAIAYVGREGSRRKQQALTTQLVERGVPAEEIPQKYGAGTPEQPFQFTAAEAGAKDNYRKEITSLYNKLRSEKQKWEGDLLHRNTPFPDDEDFQAARSEFVRVMGRGGNRGGGVEGVINPRASAPAGNQPQFPAGSRQAAQYNAPTGPVNMPAPVTPAIAPATPATTPAPTVSTISVAEASAQAGRPIPRGQVFRDKHGNRVLVQ